MQATLESIQKAIDMGLGKITYGKLQHGSLIQLEDVKSGKVLTIEVVDEDFVYEGRKTVSFSIRRQANVDKEWVALVKGTHPKYNLKRKFVPVASREWDGWGNEGWTNFELAEGELYEVNEPYEGRYFVTVENGEIKRVSESEAMKMAEKIEKGEQ